MFTGGEGFVCPKCASEPIQIDGDYSHFIDVVSPIVCPSCSHRFEGWAEVTVLFHSRELTALEDDELAPSIGSGEVPEA